jgi:hypothetical protein
MQKEELLQHLMDQRELQRVLPLQWQSPCSIRNKLWHKTLEII